MPRKRKDELERAIETALAPGVFIGYRDRWEFLERLKAVRAKIAALMGMGEAEAGRAVALLETFIAGCYEKSEEIDDSGGSFGQLVGTLFCDWIRARQAAGADPDETAGVLLSWMENDDYGYCYRLEKEAVKVLDRAGLTAFEREILKKLGRSGEALASAWEHYQRAPSVFSYQDLMKFVAKGERGKWHAKALAALDEATSRRGSSSSSRRESGRGWPR